MERPKQQALAFLLGALLVGGALGFSADRVMRRDDQTPAARRAAFYEAIGLTAAQKPAMDSILDDRNCRMDSVVKTIQPTLDSIRTASRVQMDRILTPEQHTKIEVRRKDDAARWAADHKRSSASCGK
ncbi:MAG TPA: hypothetical protein VGP25_17315 [Gemmatimonadaceae bacterium]|jgi:hypothetical protein|nr:hypothetical protein [Gemmatimonadaceae bacterium]